MPFLEFYPEKRENTHRPRSVAWKLPERRSYLISAFLSRITAALCARSSRRSCSRGAQQAQRAGYTSVPSIVPHIAPVRCAPGPAAAPAAGGFSRAQRGLVGMAV